MKVLVVDDHPLFRLAVRGILCGTFADVQVTDAGDYEETLAVIEGQSFDLVLLDLHMPGLCGIEALVSLKSRIGATPVVVVSANEDEAQFSSVLACGAAGYIPKSLDPERIRAALSLVMNGGCYHPASKPTAPPLDRDKRLTPREIQVANGLARLLTNKQIALELGLSANTVKDYVQAVIAKFGVASRSEVVAVLRGTAGDLPRKAP